MKLSFKYVACVTLICLASFTFARVPNPELIERSFRKEGNIFKRNANQASFCFYDFNVYTSNTKDAVITNTYGCFSSYVINFLPNNEVIQIDLKSNSGFNCGADELVINDNTGVQLVACDNTVTSNKLRSGQTVTFKSQVNANWVRIARVNHIDLTINITIKNVNDTDTVDPVVPVEPSPNPGSCGVQDSKYPPSTVSQKIVGGNNANEHSWPWQAGLILKGYGQYCAGSLINNQWILTAAHCNDFNLVRFEVHLGFDNITQTINENPKGRVYNPIVAKSHPNFNSDTLENDVALIKLDKPVEYTAEIKPICLPNKQVKDGEEGYVIGWGTQAADGNGYSSDLLKQVKVPIRPDNDCTSIYYSNYKVDTQICAGVASPGNYKDSCQGDSGGPYFMNDQNEGSYYQVGIVSYGIQCGGDGVYTDVFAYKDWIKQVQDANP